MDASRINRYINFVLDEIGMSTHVDRFELSCEFETAAYFIDILADEGLLTIEDSNTLNTSMVPRITNKFSQIGARVIADVVIKNTDEKLGLFNKARELGYLRDAAEDILLELWQLMLDAVEGHIDHITLSQHELLVDAFANTTQRMLDNYDAWAEAQLRKLAIS